MTDQNYAAVCLVVDRSASMRSIKAATEEAVNGYIAGLADLPVDRVTVRVVTFDDRYEQEHPSRVLSEVPKFVLHPRGNTALVDAWGKSIVEFGEELAALPEAERPGTVFFALATDGGENSSQEWNIADVKALVTKQREDYGWHIVFLGASEDAINVGESFGVLAGSAMRYATSRAGLIGTQDSLSNYTASAVAGAPAEFSNEDRKRAMGGKS